VYTGTHKVNLNKPEYTMHIITIKSRKLGEDFEFTQKGLYLYCNERQICEGGGFLGNTLWCTKGDNEQAKTICIKWYAQMMRKSNHERI